MNELIKITEQGGKRAVNARELHAFLGVETRFNDWIKYRIENYDLIEGEDYVVLITENSVIKKGRGGDRRSIEYALSIDCAKELSMVENNERGKQARRYFIECEKVLQEQMQKTLPSYAQKIISKSHNPQIKEIQMELCRAIRENFNNGDKQKIAEKLNIPYGAVVGILAGRWFNYEVISLGYEIAMENKNCYADKMLEMLNNIKI